MNLHEYQAKELLNRYGITVQRGKLAYSADEAVTAAQQIQAETGSGWVVVKAQVHAGGRGKGGGVKLAKNLDEVREKAGAIIGMHLITPQTSAEGKLVRKVLITEDMYVPGPSEIKEYYMSVLLDRAKGCNVIVYSTEAVMDIEHVPQTPPHLVHKEWIDPIIGLQPFQERRFAFPLRVIADGRAGAFHQRGGPQRHLDHAAPAWRHGGRGDDGWR